MPPLAARFRLPALVALGLLQEAVLIALVSRPHTPAFALACLAATLPFYLIAVWLAWRSPAVPLRLWFGFALLFRLTLLPWAPTLSQDLYRYRWDGKLQSFAFGFNPYVVAPNDPVLNAIRAGDGAVNASGVASFRPPLAELVFHRAYGLGHGLWVQKLPWLIGELLLWWLLVRMLRARGQPPHRVLLAAWAPLTIFEIAGSGHLDAGAALLAMLAVHWLGRRDKLAGIALVSAIAIQWYAVALLPLYFARARGRHWLLAVIMAAWATLLTLPYLFFNRHQDLALMGRNFRAFAVSNLGGNASWYWVERHFLAPGPALAVGAAAWAGVIAWMLARGRANEKVAVASVGGLFLVAPFVFPWFLVFVLPWLTLSVDAGWFWWTLAAPLAYLHHGPLPRLVEYVPVFVLLAWAAMARRRSAPAA